MIPERMVVAGGGPAGLSAAIYAGRAGLAPVVLEGAVPGGQLGQIERIDNYPGFAEGVGGADLALAMRAQAERFGARLRPGEEAASLSVLPDGSLEIGASGGGTIRARTLVVATGTRPRRLGVPGEAAFEGRGVSYCATCDGAFFKGREVAVAGGGAEAFGAALYLARLCSRVTILFPETEPAARGPAVDSARANPAIGIRAATRVLEVLGEGRAVRRPATPAVLHSVWRAPDGRLAATLCNWTREPQPFALSTPDLTASGTVPARSWMLVTP